jgi:hypothetical protein
MTIEARASIFKNRQEGTYWGSPVGRDGVANPVAVAYFEIVMVKGDDF